MKRAALVLALALATVSAPASGASLFELYAEHPSVMAQPESGRYIHDLAVSGGELYLGYGDYTANTGPIDIAVVDLTTGATSVKATVNTEAIETYRLINGRLYAPWIDPKGSGGIYTSNQSGTWAHYGTTVPSEHVYDVAILPSGVQVAVGSSNAGGVYRGATAWVSRDNGATWTVEMTDLTNPRNQTVSGFERYYWIAVINGKAYMQAMDNGGGFPVRVFDGNRWSTIRKSAECNVGAGHRAESFNGKIYCTNGTVFNGRRSTTSGGIIASDFFQYGGDLWALSSDRVMRLENGVWVQEAVFLGAWRGASLAVTATHFYVGDSLGFVYRASR